MTLRRGFRTEAERRASSIRSELGLAPSDAISLRAVAEARGWRIVAADTLVDLQELVELEAIQKFAFSACTFEIPGASVIVYNPLRSEARRRSDIAHELAHLLLEHQLTEIREVAGVPFRTCRPDQEEEATTLGGTVLLPRPLLLHAARAGMTPEAIAAKYRVSVEMARFRVNTTGVALQMQRAKARK